MHPLIPWFEPPAIPLGPLTVHAFGVLVACGFYFGSAVAQQKAAKFGGNPDAINRLVGWLVLGVFVGGHWGHVLFYDPASLRDDPLVLLKVWQGLSSFGGFLVCVPLTVWFFRKERLNFWPHADALAIGLTLGWFLGRLGCFTAHDHPGIETNFWLGVYGMCPGNNPAVACHDLGLYEAIWSLSVFGLFLFLDRVPRPPGFFCGWLATLYAPCRFASDFFRNPEQDTRYFGLTPAQYGCMVLLAVGVWTLTTARSRAPAVATA